MEMTTICQRNSRSFTDLDTTNYCDNRALPLGLFSCMCWTVHLKDSLNALHQTQ